MISKYPNTLEAVIIPMQKRWCLWLAAMNVTFVILLIFTMLQHPIYPCHDICNIWGLRWNCLWHDGNISGILLCSGKMLTTFKCPKHFMGLGLEFLVFRVYRMMIHKNIWYGTLYSRCLNSLGQEKQNACTKMETLKYRVCTKFKHCLRIVLICHWHVVDVMLLVLPPKQWQLIFPTTLQASENCWMQQLWNLHSSKWIS